MEAEKQQDPFASKQTASQEAKLPNCPPARDSEICLVSNNEHFSFSPYQMPSEATGIVVISLPDSRCSADQHTLEEEEDAVFVTPPEYNSSSHLSDQNPNELCVAEARDVIKGRVSGVGLADEPEMERDEEMDDYVVVPLGETEGDADEIIVLGSGDSGAEEIRATSNLDAAAGEAGTVSIVREFGGLLSNCVAANGNHELVQNVEATGVPRAEKPNKYRDSSGALDSGEIAKLKRIAGKSCVKVRLRIRGIDKAVKTPKDAKKRKEGHESGHGRSGRKRIEEIDEFRYDGKFEGRTGGGSGSKRPSLKGKGREVVESSEKRSESLKFLDVLKTVFGGTDGGCDCDEDVDIIETAKRRGVTFPRPRWWPDGDGDGEGYPS